MENLWIGEAAPDTRSVDGDVDSTSKVYFFHARHCRPCKSIMPLVDGLREDFPNLIKIEIGEHMQLIPAKVFQYSVEQDVDLDQATRPRLTARCEPHGDALCDHHRRIEIR